MNCRLGVLLFALSSAALASPPAEADPAASKPTKKAKGKAVKKVPKDQATKAAPP